MVQGSVELSVEDSGPGIPKALKERVFERFFRITGSESTGTGLGLSISKSFIDQMSGEITCESKEGSGTKFTITLPQATMEIGKTA